MSALKFKNNLGEWQSIPMIRGKKGDKGDTGETGNSGVYIGTEAPTDEDVNVWIDTDGQPDSVTSLKYVKDDASDNGGVIEGWVTLPENLSEGIFVNTASGEYSHAEGYASKATGKWSHCENAMNVADGEAAHAEGYSTEAHGDDSHSEGQYTKAKSSASHAEGMSTTAINTAAHAEGISTTASGASAHSEGNGTTASGGRSHAEGGGTTASGAQSHAEGASTIANGENSHAENYATTANGSCSHASGNGTIAYSRSQFVLGEFNVPETKGYVSTRSNHAFIIGNGADANNRSNALVVKWDGNIILADGREINPNDLNIYYHFGSPYQYQGEMCADITEIFDQTINFGRIHLILSDGVIYRYAYNYFDYVYHHVWSTPVMYDAVEKKRYILTAKTYDYKRFVLKRINLDDVATQTSDGWMSKQDKERLDTLYSEFNQFVVNVEQYDSQPYMRADKTYAQITTIVETENYPVVKYVDRTTEYPRPDFNGMYPYTGKLNDGERDYYHFTRASMHIDGGGNNLCTFDDILIFEDGEIRADSNSVQMT